MAILYNEKEIKYMQVKDLSAYIYCYYRDNLKDK